MEYTWAVAGINDHPYQQTTTMQIGCSANPLGSNALNKVTSNYLGFALSKKLTRRRMNEMGHIFYLQCPVICPRYTTVLWCLQCIWLPLCYYNDIREIRLGDNFKPQVVMVSMRPLTQTLSDSKDEAIYVFAILSIISPITTRYANVNTKS